MNRPSTQLLAVALVIALVFSSALAGPPPSYGIDFVTVGAPGNRNTIPSEVPNRPYLEIGAVNYQYRIARTEITATQWLEFVQGYAPYWQGSPSDPSFTSWWIRPGSDGAYHVMSGYEQAPADMGWRMAARYCNWLHNGKVTEQSAFENGAYDTSTFIDNPDGSIGDQQTRSPGALFWIPSRDEWTKATFYDPDRYGDDEAGYWQFPNGTDEPLIPGLPEEGAETNAGLMFHDEIDAMPVGSYPTVQSPWGLLDVSGGVGEWSEAQEGTTSGRWVIGTRIRENEWFDQLDWLGHRIGVDHASAGLRVASAIPSTPSLMCLTVASCLLKRRRT